MTEALARNEGVYLGKRLYENIHYDVRLKRDARQIFPAAIKEHDTLALVMYLTGMLWADGNITISKYKPEHDDTYKRAVHYRLEMVPISIFEELNKTYREMFERLVGETLWSQYKAGENAGLHRKVVQLICELALPVFAQNSIPQPRKLLCLDIAYRYQCINFDGLSKEKRICLNKKMFIHKPRP